MSSCIQKNASTHSGAIAVAAFTAYSPEVGSKEWYYYLMAKPKRDWSSNETAYFVKSCFF